MTALERGTPLHLAAKSNYLPICQILLLQGIDLSIKDSNGNLAKDVTTNLNIHNLIEKYENQEQQYNNMIDEIKEEEEDENDDDEEVKSSDEKRLKRMATSPRANHALSTNLIVETKKNGGKD